MLQIFAHANLPHEFVLVTIHSRQLSNVSKDVLQTISQLEGVYIVETILHVRIDDELSQTQDFPTQMES